MAVDRLRIDHPITVTGLCSCTVCEFNRAHETGDLHAMAAAFDAETERRGWACERLLPYRGLCDRCAAHADEDYR